MSTEIAELGAERGITTTPRGTPCARSWTPDWIARVEEREDALNRRICGARTIGHTPCPAPSTHSSGRCAHHGGFDLTGAPEGNRNAVVHNLYSRRLMPCGEHCPAWRSCPLGGGAADSGKEMLSRAFPDRPTCPYEQTEYTAVVTDALRRTQNHHANAWGLHVAHQVALMTVLVSRAARALATRSFTDSVENYQDDHLIISERPSAALIAYEKLARELRRWTLLLERSYAWISCDNDTAQHHRHRQTTDTSPDPDSLAATAAGQELFNHRGHREHGEGQTPNRQDEQDFSGVNGNEFQDPSNAWPPLTSSASSVVKEFDLSDRIHTLIADTVPELLTPLKTSDPPGSSLHHILNPP